MTEGPIRRLVLVRHGESRWNVEGRIQGQRCAGLSPTGREQAKHVAAALAAAHPDAHLVSSDLRRCRETMAPLADALRRTPDEEPRLRERGFGHWEGRSRADVIAHESQRWARWTAGEDVLAEVRGESGEGFSRRVLTVLRELIAGTADDKSGGTTIAVTHAGPAWYGTHLLLGLPLATLGSVANASVTELIAGDLSVAEVSRKNAIVLDRWNELGHLPIELRPMSQISCANPG